MFCSEEIGTLHYVRFTTLFTLIEVTCDNIKKACLFPNVLFNFIDILIFALSNNITSILFTWPFGGVEGMSGGLEGL